MTKEKFLKFYVGKYNFIDAKLCYEALEEAFNNIGETNLFVLLGALATVRIEVGKAFKPVRENLAYSSPALLTYFPRYFSPTDAKKYAYNPEAIANRAYANRMGNGDEKSGDGWRYRGAGFIQCTGKYNWELYGFTEENCLDIKQNAKFVAQYFKDRGIIPLCIEASKYPINSPMWKEAWTRVRIKVNGGKNGLKEFLEVLAQYQS